MITRFTSRVVHLCARQSQTILAGTRSSFSSESEPKLQDPAGLNRDEPLTTDERYLVDALIRRHFKMKQIGNILTHLEWNTERKLGDLSSVLQSIDYWSNSIAPPKLHDDELAEIGKKFNFRTVDVNYVLSQVEPDLLLIKPEAMNERLQRLKTIGFLSGKSDLWRVFVFAPRGYFLQDWGEFQRKYHYMQHRVIEWLHQKKRDKYQSPHPFVKHARVFEMPYEHIKTRFLFAVRTGLQAPSISAKLDNKVEEIDLGRLMLADLADYLAFVAPYCTDEEYLVFEQMVTDVEDEDDEVINELCELSMKGFQRNFSSKKKKVRAPRERLMLAHVET